ncbi:hypothetical protein BESB_033770 [Besnoitia besnoiti]|uniref:SRS domain-containing protein n=1 Tax=Besnoitia besnoiti TaxID=94643 RepID=A0A2A9MG78_BESBE|nr:hypothetical protein BESB_033770 [Besnoitia besnoiti]PFH36919.1 hypothetical protein BESB_033770 [Besnoitia besnoiti]
MSALHISMAQFCVCVGVIAVICLTGPGRVYGEPPGAPPHSPDNGAQVCDQATGEEPEKRIQLTLDDEKEAVSFKCTADKTKVVLEPNPAKSNVYVGSDCSPASKKELQSELLSAELTESPEGDQGDNTVKTYTLRLSPEKRKEINLCYVCKITKASVGRSRGRSGPDVQETTVCQVHIAVKKPKAEQSGPDQPHASDPKTECRSGSVTATASKEKPLSFKCGDGMMLTPTSLTKVFDDKDERCEAETDLQSLFDGELEQGKLGDGTYTLNVKKPPANTTPICYQCVREAGGTDSSQVPPPRGAGMVDGKCLLKISVAGTSGISSSAGLSVRHLLSGGGVAAALLFMAV